MCTHYLALAAAVALALAPSPLARPRTQEPAQHGTAVVPPEEILAGMDWLAGTWSGPMWGGRFSAYYSTPEGGKILGHSRLVKAKEEVFYEFELFEARGPLVHLQPFPRGERAVAMQLRSHDPETRTAVFEHPDKDYPTRIVYQRASDDELVITLSDPHGGSGKTERFALRR